MTDLTPRELLRLNLSEQWLRIRRPLLERLERDFKQWQFDTNTLEGVDKEYLPLIQLALFLQQKIEQDLERIETCHQQFAEFRHAYQSAVKVDEARSHMLSIAEQLGYSKRALKRIESGNAQWLDQNAIFDRNVQTIAALEQDVSVTLQRLADLVSFLLGYVDAKAASHIWQVLSLHTHLLRPLEYHGNVHVRTAAFACLGQSLKVLRSLPQEVSHRVPANIVQYVFRTCLDKKNDIWIRSEAITLVFQLDSQQFLSVLSKIFVANPTSDPFLRGRVVALMCQYDAADVAIDNAVTHVLVDPSDYVRQCFAKQCVGFGEERGLSLLQQIIDLDGCGKVRAQAYLSLGQLLTYRIQDDVVNMQLAALEHETDVFALRTLMYTLPQCAVYLPANAIEQLSEGLVHLHQHHERTDIRRWAGQCKEHLWFIANQNMLDEQSRGQIEQLAFQKSCTVKVPEDVENESLYRYIGHLGRQRFGYDIQVKRRKLKLTAGFKFGFRFWRMWHEFLNTATDKRQNHNHLKGRLYYGQVQTGTDKMAELSSTKVPGEPLFINEEACARDYLPLLDQVLSSLDQGWPTQPVKLYSAQGITHILPPRNIFHRLYARTVLQFRFKQLARLRNWQKNDTGQPNDYTDALAKLGFHIWVEGYVDDHKKLPIEQQSVEPRVQRFFSLSPLPFALPSLGDMQNYFYSVYQNNIMQLIAFSCVATAGFLTAHISKLVQLRKHRKNIPLVIGGWGTRGKSGTERLKAALFNSLGLSVVSKTTGCEAMFLYGPANRPMKEMFLFRPYDKASIWEQVFITGLSSKLGADVFLWECMGLTPRYIDIIQNQWMRDDLCTITNCYPDHEDLQGPAGIEIPIVMQRFVPRNSHLLTSEDSMLPLLEDAANQKRTALTKVTWLEAGLLTDDVINRFPYEEHPNNIALVAKLAEALGIEEDFALKEMADNVVADLGVLKIYPVAQVQGRKLSFINGMSANERLGALGNWQRTGLADYTLAANPDVWLGIVVNNRADRIARSQVFASMLVNDMQADCYVFIGNNLTGLQSYIDEAWQNFAENQDLSQQKLVDLAVRFRIPMDWATVLARLKACFSEHAGQVEQWPTGLDDQQWLVPQVDGLDTAAIAHRFEVDCERLSEFNHYNQQLQNGDDCQAKALEWIYAVFQSQWVVIEDYYSTGNQTINTLVQHTPPGLTAKLIGVQNIKGTGLDFIYRWQAWDVVNRHCETLCNSFDELALEEAVKALTSWEEFGILDREKVQHAIDLVKDRPQAQKELIQAELRLIEQRLEKQLSAIAESLQSDKRQSKTFSRLLSGLEAFLDASDAVKRRKRADAIYQDLLEGLISYDKASLELAKLTKAQKGGWLEQRVKARFG